MKIKIKLNEEKQNFFNDLIIKMKNSLNSDDNLRNRLKTFSFVLDEIYDSFGDEGMKRAFNSMSMTMMKMNEKEVDVFLEIVSHKPYSGLL